MGEELGHEGGASNGEPFLGIMGRETGKNSARPALNLNHRGVFRTYLVATIIYVRHIDHRSLYTRCNTRILLTYPQRT